MLSFVRRLGKTCRANMVNKTFLPPAKHPAKRLSPSKIGISGLGTGFADALDEPHGLGEPWWFEEIGKSPPGRATFLQIVAEGENHRWRMRFSSDFRGR
jgi:hypothetical protein